ncbi:MAG: hypothetical protein JW726_15130, partial [Anaerolineales bacterium]|nr:hypothetical protein [Anaerolineales bacterium]
MPDPLPFLPGSSSSAARGAIIQRAEPLARYLPPVGNGVISAWLHRQVSPGAWILDPFGAAPRLAIESARVGYRVLVAINNPIARFLLEMAADPPPLSELQAALAELASAFKGSERIEPLIRSLYQTDCSHCGHAITADAFLWEKGAEAPYGRIYRCPNCGDTGERPTSRADTDRSAQIGSAGLHRARALERIAPPHDPDRIHAEEALEAYLPRAVYALFTLFNKLDGLELSPLRRRCLHALLLSACDQGNTLWAHPTARERPRQIIIPTRFRENNIWLSLEKAIETWQANPGQPDKIPLMLWPEQPPPTGGICMFEGRLKDLAGSLKDHLPIQAVAAALPRPNQAYWTLCALWAGWLWGREAIGPFKSVLRRRRYDWSWHTSALHAALSYLAPVLSSGTPFLGLIGEAEPQFLIAALAAADASGFALQNLALRPESAQAQITWQREDGPSSTAQASSTLEAAIEIAHQQAADLLRQIGEPITYLPMFTAGLGGLARARHFWLMHASWQKIPTTTKDA